MGKGKQEQEGVEDDSTKAGGFEEGKKLLEVEENNDVEEDDGPPPPPDGGWGWVIVAASFMCNMVLDGIGYSFGILLKPLMSYYQASKGEIAMVGSILAGFIMLVGPISSSLVNKFGPRKTCIAGALVSSLAIFISTFSPNVYMLMISYGVCGGLGLGLMYVPAVTAVGYWFEKKRSLVTGISTCGSGFGTIVFAPVVTILESTLQWQWCNRIVALFCLMCTLLGATMKPVPTRKVTKRDSIEEIKEENKKPIIKEKAFNASKEEIDYMDGDEATVKALPKKDEENGKNNKQKEEKSGYLTVLKNVPFLLVMLGNLPAVMGLYIPYAFLPALTQQKGLVKSQSALLISLIGFFNTGGRIVSGAVTDHPKVDALFVTTIALAWGAVCPFLMTFCTDFWSFCLVCIMFGISLSAWPAVTSSMLVDMLGLELLTSAFGVLTCIRGASAFLGPPLGGFVIDYTSPPKIAANLTMAVTEMATGNSTLSDTGEVAEVDTDNYNIAFIISAILLGMSALGHGVAFCVNKSTKRRKAKTTEA